MMLLDTNVPIYAFDTSSIHHDWARNVIADAVATEGAAVNAIVLAEICVGATDPSTAVDRIRRWGVRMFDLPSAAAEICAEAYRLYRRRRRAQSGVAAPRTPLPDFFIGAHAQAMRWRLATADTARIASYFPLIPLKSP